MRLQITLLFLSAVCSSLWATDSQPVGLIENGGRFYVPTVVRDAAGTDHEVAFLLDTGTSRTFINAAFVPGAVWTYDNGTATNFSTLWKLSTIWGTIQTDKRTEIPELRVGDRTFRSVSVLAFDSDWGLYSRSVDTGDGSLPVLGILGADILFSSSVYLSLAERVLQWTDKQPWPAERTLPLQKLSNDLLAVQAQFPLQADTERFLIDTGSFPVVVPDLYVEPIASADSHHWIRLTETLAALYSTEGATATRIIGELLWDSPFRADSAEAHRVWGIPPPSDQPLCLFGTEALSAWDLWFDLSPNSDPEILMRRAESASRARFLNSVTKEDWEFPQKIRGISITSGTRSVAGTYTWGDGEPFIEGVAIGDNLISIGGKPYVPGESFPLDDGPLELVWERPDGSRLVTHSPRRLVFSNEKHHE